MREGLPFSQELCWVLICISSQLGGCSSDSSSFADEKLKLGHYLVGGGEGAGSLQALTAFDIVRRVTFWM